jgi:hypothetical protein
MDELTSHGRVQWTRFLSDEVAETDEESSGA